MNDLTIKPAVTGTELAIATVWKAVDVWLEAVRHTQSTCASVFPC